MANKAEKLHMSKVAELGCIACRINGIYDTPACLHHIRHGQGMSQRANSYQVIPLCPTHHQYGDGTATYEYQYALHRSPIEFEDAFGTEEDLLAQVLQLVN